MNKTNELNIADQIKGFGNSYIDFPHFEENLGFLEDGNYSGAVHINLKGGRKMQNMSDGLNFLTTELAKKQFKNISELIININSYEYRQLSSFNGLGGIIRGLPNLNQFKLSYDRHQIHWEDIASFLEQILSSKSLKDSDLSFESGIGDYHKMTFMSKFNLVQNELRLTTYDIDIHIAEKVIQFVCSQDQLSHIIIDGKNSIECGYDINQAILISIIKGNQSNTNQNKLYSLKLELYSNKYCCTHHPSIKYLENAIKKQNLKLVLFSMVEY